jgi:lipopolysaccharide/colanic/teichoic acid biosynthesis glycosyltransferase
MSVLERHVTSPREIPVDAARGQNLASRAFQILLCLAGLAILSPVMALIALAVKLTSRGPIFYRGQRVGKDERIFHIYKFRTLEVDAEKKIGARLLTEGDSVYTPIGKFLKKWKLDELPQLFNVIMGDMSLVGPRPVRPIFLDRFKQEIPGYTRRFRVRPGATGLAQLRGGYWTEPRNKLRYEVVYIRHQSLLLDLKLMALTFIKIFNRFVTASAVIAALFIFASFFPAALYPWLYVTLYGVKLNLLHLAIVFFGVWMVAKKSYSHRLYLYRSPLYLPMALFAGVGILSAIFSPDPETALRGTGYYVVTGFLVTLTLLNARLASDVGRSAATLAGLACFGLSLLGLFELALMKQSALLAGVAESQGVRVASSWAIKATFAKSDVLAAYLVLGFPLLLCQLVNSRTRHGRDFWLVATTVSFTSILLTQDFLGLLALLVACAVFLAYASSRTVPLVICLFLVPMLVIGAWDKSGTLSRTYEPIRDKVSKEVRVIRSAPLHQVLLGSGAKSLNAQPGQNVAPRKDQVRVAADNAHLSLILEMGLLGWLVMLVILATALRGVHHGMQRARNPYQRSLLGAIFASGVGFLISMMGVNVFFQISLQIFFWGLIGLGLGLAVRVTGTGGRLVNIWRFGDERPRPVRPRTGDAGPDPLTVAPSHGARVAD